MKRILVVEDEDLLRSAIAEVLRMQGYEVLEATDGAKALDLARRQAPDLIVSDVRMEPMTGTELLTALREDPAIAATPFILMTGATDKTPLRKGMRLGADDYLAKPFPLTELVEAVEARLRKHQQVRTQAEAKVTELRTNLSLSLPHELLTPLTCILGYSDMILTGYDTLQPTQILEMVSDIQKCGNRLLRLSQNYLFYASLELLSKDPRKVQALKSRQTASCLEPIRTAVQNIARKYSRLDNLNLKLADSPVAMSEDYLIKVIEELADNAFKFSEAGAPVSITSSTLAQDFHLVIRDQGRGMRPDQIAQIGAYQQFDRNIHEQQGTGLGLAIAKRLAELHGGTIDIQSQPSGGTTISIRLPAS
jgi:two-component system, sensor histidine kinase and response regulator